ncbi:extracellular solute-binding protein [Thiogranum longum]|uniref:Extracellular solute-binding protein n=1 Tax=Thiogranum longum TaxID=1537524 RepID=A0A4R1HCE4_9GAMM|nr:substrate-binding domain-containing protein [Thiogranum longum]TCK17870.1 extracellular solute-binding protein [Thiogranum longum]
MFKKNTLTAVIIALTTGLAALPVAVTADDDDKDKDGFVLTGNCAQLPADRTTEFHGNPATSNLNLAMAGNQWVVFDKFMQAFNELRAEDDDDIDLTAIGNQPRTFAGLQKKGADYFIELIPPGQERNQIKSGCMLLGNEDPRNYLPTSIQVDFDVFTSTNFNLMRDLAANGFVTEAIPYIRNQLTLMTDATNSTGIGDAADPTIDATLDLLDPAIRVSEVDHINEGVHRGINAMYQRMDEYTRLNGTAADIAALDMLLSAVANPQPGSPAATRTGVSTNFSLATNPACNYSGHASIADGTLRMCEFAILNKANTHETRVHHVETPSRILAGESDVGPVWVSELQLAVNNGDAVSGFQPIDAVNRPVVYSVAFLATMQKKHRKLAKKWVDFLRSPEGVQIYVDGGFSALTGSEQGERYSIADDGSLVIVPFTP